MEPEDREFMRELLLRHEKATDARESVADMQGERHALCRVLDRLDGKGA
jgi:hypothetical protein